VVQRLGLEVLELEPVSVQDFEQEGLEFLRQVRE
jgi:hypothetical protein